MKHSSIFNEKFIDLNENRYRATACHEHAERRRTAANLPQIHHF